MSDSHEPENLETTEVQGNQEEPEIYSVKVNGDEVSFSRRNFVKSAAALTAGATVLGAASAVNAQTATPTPDGTVTGDCFVRTDSWEVNVYVGPGRDRAVRRYLPRNEDVPVIGSEELDDGSLWWQVELGLSGETWVADEDVEVIGECAATEEPLVECYVTTDEDEVGIYVGPGRNRSIRAYMPRDEEFLVIGQAEVDDELWWSIEFRNFEEAWVADEDVEVIGDCGAVGAATPPPIRTREATAAPTDQPTPTAQPGQRGSVPPGETGINYTLNGVTYTLPCGSPIPDNAVCVCNCVSPPAPRGCSCDSYTSHYWYPN